MKKLILCLLCAVIFLSTFTACNNENKEAGTESSVSANSSATKDYLGNYYAPQAEVMGTKATAEIKDDGTFVMVSEYQKNKSTITGNYRELSPNQLLLLPEKQVLVENGKKKTNDMSEAASILAEFKDNQLVFSNGTTDDVIYKKIEE